MSQLKIKDGNNWIAIPEGGVGVPSGGSAGNVLVKSSSTDYATGWAFRGFELLWENPNPTSAFAEQTVSLNLSGYSFVLVQAVLNASSSTSNALYTFCAVPGRCVMQSILNVSGTSTSTPLVVTRNIETSSSGINFASGYSKNANATSTAPSTDNNRMAPLKIWGVKL